MIFFLLILAFLGLTLVVLKLLLGGNLDKCREWLMACAAGRKSPSHKKEEFIFQNWGL